MEQFLTSSRRAHNDANRDGWLGNLEVSNAFTDGPWRFRRNRLRRNDRDLASLAWRLANDRQMAGLGSTAVLHQLGHSEERKRAGQFDTHEVYNSTADALTHQLDDTMPLYASFRRALRGRTTIWYEPLEEENAGRSRRLPRGDGRRVQAHHGVCAAAALDRAGWRQGRCLSRHVRQGRDRSRPFRKQVHFRLQAHARAPSD